LAGDGADDAVHYKIKARRSLGERKKGNIEKVYCECGELEVGELEMLLKGAVQQF
jgi:hypothetical protein